jgi:transcriptional regulator with XRE-family HTH domain
MNKELKSKIFLEFYTQEDFAAAIEERPSLVSNVIRGRRNISDEKKKAWATALRCSVDEIFPIKHAVLKKEDTSDEKRFCLR